MNAPNIVDHRALRGAERHPTGTCEVAGALISSRMPPSEPLWIYRLRMSPGGYLRWGSDHGDESILVTAGTLRGQGTAGADDVIVVERGVSTELMADEACELWHMGYLDEQCRGPLGPPTDTERSSYVVYEGERPYRESVSESGVTVTLRYWADSTRATSRLALFEVSAPSGHRAPSHSHTADEIICLLDGDLQVGRHKLRPRMSIFVPGGFRYGFTAMGPYRFINFRSDSSMVTTRPSEPAILETCGLQSN